EQYEISNNQTELIVDEMIIDEEISTTIIYNKALKIKRPPVMRLTGIATLPSTLSRNTKPLTKSTAPTNSNARSDMQTPIFFRHACPWGGPRASTSCPRTTESKDFHSVGTLEIGRAHV